MGENLLTPSKITAWLDCEHYLTLRRQADAGELSVQNAGLGAFAQLLLDKGLDHERACRGALVAEGRTVFDVPERAEREPFATWTKRVAGTIEEGHDVLYQFPFVHDAMRGIADFLVKVEGPSRLGDFHYEPLDAKLTRTAAKPGHVLQLCFYADALEAVQGVRPERLHLHLGSGRMETIRLCDVEAYWHRLRQRLARVIDDGPHAQTVPEPCDQCDFCEFAGVCEKAWRSADALHYVAGIRRPEIVALHEGGVSTLAGLASEDVLGRTEEIVDGETSIRLERLVVLHEQAALQHRAVEGEPPPFEVIPDDVDADDTTRRRGMLPAPDPGDVFLDYEGHPFWRPERGLFFLFGLLTGGAHGEWAYEARWAHDEASEGQRAGELIRWIAARRATHPAMHVYHYNHTERSALEAMAAEHGVEEQLLAELIEAGVFVDVLDVVRRRVRVGAESYGLKTLERVAGYERGHEIDRGASAVVAYETYCADGDETHLERIARYNADDVRATKAVRDWLLDGPLAGEPARPELDDAEEATDAEEDDTDELVARLTASDEDWKQLFGHLLEYWSREGRAHWAQRAPLFEADPDTQLCHPEMIGGLRFLEMRAPQGKQKDDRAVFSFPPQELAAELIPGKGKRLMYPTGDGGIRVVTVDEIDAAGELVAAWPERVQDGPMPAAVVLDDWVSPRPKPGALAAYARRVLAGTETDADRVRAALLRRDLPRFAGGRGPVGGVFGSRVDDLVGLVADLDHSVLAVQGPPGTGKTHAGAEIIDALLRRGKRVGVTAFSHAAIDNLVRKVLDKRPGTRVLRQGAAPLDPGRRIPGATYNGDGAKWAKGGHDLLAGTSWMFANDKAIGALDVLVIDEAGQMGLADALAALGSTTAAILLGDPLQLAQVSLANHPAGAGASALEHVLGAEETMPPERGVFLDTTWRMHPAICEFISEQIYAGRLGAHPRCAHQSVGGEAGLRWVRAEHEGCETFSPSEAALVVEVVRSLLGAEYVDADGAGRPLSAADVMVVAPYNDHVDCVRAALDEQRLDAVRVGTVDKFQGQEAAVVVFSMATSDEGCMPRTAGFLYSRNRFNVAVSRARALAYVVCTEALLDTRARSVQEMRLIGTLCSFVDAATGPTPTATPTR